MNLTYEALLNAFEYSQTNLGTALTNSTAATDVSPGANNAGQAYTFKASTLKVGIAFRITATGIVSTTGTPNLTLGIYWGGIAGTALATTGAVATASGLSNATWMLRADARVDAVGASGTIRTIGMITGINGTQMIPATSSSGNAVTVDTTIDKILTLGATWGTASASNSIQVVTFGIERLNEGA